MSDTEEFKPSVNMDENIRSILNVLFAKSVMIEHITYALFINFAKGRPDPERVLNRMVEQLHSVKDELFSASHMAECRAACEVMIQNVENTFRTAERAY